MEWLGKFTFCFRKVWNRATTRFRVPKSGLGRLRHDIMSCEYEDVHILWGLLEKSDTRFSRDFGSKKRGPFSRMVHWVWFQNEGFWNVDFVLGVWNCFALSLIVLNSRLFELFIFSLPDSDLAHHKNIIQLTKPNRKLNQFIGDESGNGNIDEDDYLPNDPAPSSKASIRPGPIEHGAPLMPYIPKPAPPSPGPYEANYVASP
ncbi:hypothetical protein CTI12_AA052430 [Artemisia annua]|uniref:Uncharacterized protein n=1 Tax=Artemisia annua TaxID=35608 RepID=A0A2U1Q3X8_ARTAN|nr:hypothetical protein CTI12_AA052430 [Artemisia annua]